jgi:hypothetical protein
MSPSLLLGNGGADVAAKTPIEEPQIVPAITTDVDAAELVDALAIFQKIAREGDAAGNCRQGKVLPGQGVERLAVGLGVAEGYVDFINFCG